METIGVMRIHTFPLAETHTVDRLAEVVDGMCLLFSPATPEETMHRLLAHPKCIDGARYEGAFHIGRTFLEAFKMVRKYNPSFVVMFDEDEIPPDRFAKEFENFKQSGCDSMGIRNFECWGDIDHVVADLCYVAKHHCHTIRWSNDTEIGTERTADYFHYYYRRPVYHCEYPLRHLAFMTPELRRRRVRRGLAASSKTHWRREAEGPGAWATWDHTTLSYDPLMSWEQYRRSGRRLFRALEKQKTRRLEPNARGGV